MILVADALRLGGAILGEFPDMLAPQLIGRLLPEIGSNPNIKSLLAECDQFGPDNCALIPFYHCLHTPGGPLKVTHKPLWSYFIFCLRFLDYSILWKVISLLYLIFKLHPIIDILCPYQIDLSRGICLRVTWPEMWIQDWKGSCKHYVWVLIIVMQQLILIITK